MNQSIPSDAGGVSAPIVEPKATAPYYPLTDIGNGERFAAMHCDTVRYCSEWKKWLVWDGTRWAVDRRGEVFLKAKETARSIAGDLQNCFDTETRKSIMKWALQSEGGQRVREMLGAAEKERNLSVLANELDKNLWAFNVQNGTLDLKTGRLHPHNPADLITKLAGTEYDEEAQCPHFEDFISSVMSEKDELVSYLQRAIGYSLAGDRREQMMLIFHGIGSNGKSRLVEALLRMFGDYGHTMEPGTISAKNNEKMATDIAELFGKRFVATSEGSENKRLDEALVKRMTGDEDLTGERKYENPFSFTPTFQVFFSSNHKPVIKGTDNGIWRRIQMVPFEVKFWDADKGETGKDKFKANKELKSLLHNELPGILKWAVEGCLEWQVKGMKAPKIVSDATAAYRAEQDTLGNFIEEYCFTGDPELTRVTVKEIYQKYLFHANESNERPMSKKSFGLSLAERGFISHRATGGVATWKGIAMKRDV